DEEEEIPYLRAKSATVAKLRWDPNVPAGIHTIWIVVDRNDTTGDINKNNNKARVDIRFRSKARLAPGGPFTYSRQSEEEKAKHIFRLQAKVANWGETAARNVMVAFFRDAEQTPDNKLGEVLVPLVPPQSVVKAEFSWQVTREQMLKGEATPSYQIYLKGSLQRISSAAPEENK
ncbi:MAG: hypothetical protein V2A74_02310, partial [bacterium]